MTTREQIEALRKVEPWPQFGPLSDPRTAARAAYNAAIDEVQAILESAPEWMAMKALDQEPLFDPEDRIMAINGEVRQPRTPADFVDAYRNRIGLRIRFGR